MRELPRPLKPHELNELIRKAQEGDLEARNMAVMANSRLVAALAEKVCSNRNREVLDDYIQTGICGHGPGNGLINAIMTYRLEGQHSALGTWPAYAKRGVLMAMNALAPDLGRQVTTRRRREKLRRVQQVARRLGTEEPAKLIEELALQGVPTSEHDVLCAFSPGTASLEPQPADYESAPEAQRAPDRKRMLALIEALPQAQRAALRKRWAFGRAPQGAKLSEGESDAADSAEASLRGHMRWSAPE